MLSMMYISTPQTVTISITVSLLYIFGAAFQSNKIVHVVALRAFRHVL